MVGLEAGHLQVDGHAVGSVQLLDGPHELVLACRCGGKIPASPAYVWRNLQLDVGHLLTYFVAHEGHHRGQIVLVARQTGSRLPAAVTAGLWQWTKRAVE